MENINIASFDFDDSKILSRLDQIKKNVDELNESRFLENKRLQELNKEYSSITKEMDKLSSSGKQQSKEYEELANKQGLYLKNIVQSKSAISEITTQTRGLNNESKQLNQTLELQSKQQALLNSDYDVEKRSINQLREDRALLIKLRNAEVAAIGEQSEVAKQLNKVLEDSTNQEKKLVAETEKRFYQIGDYSNQLDGQFQSLRDGLSRLASGDIIGGIDSLKTSFGMLATSARAFFTTPVGVALGTLAGFVAVAKYVYDYNIEMAEATKLTQQFTGLLGDDLEKATVRAKSFAETTGADLKEVTRSVNAVAKAYGISFDEAFDKVQKGYVKAGTSAEDFFDNTDEYITQFKNAGYSADEFFGIMEAGAENGTYKDKIIDSVKEIEFRLKEFAKGANDELTNAFGPKFADMLSKGLAKGSITSKEALKLIGEEAKKVGVDLQAQQRIVATVFGAMGEDAGGFVKVIETINMGLGKSKEDLNAIEKSQDNLINASRKLDEAFSDLFNMTGGGFEKMITDMKIIAFNLIIKMINGIKDFRDWFVQAYNDSQAFRLVIQSIILGFKVLGRTMLESAKVLGEFAKILGNALTFDFEAVGKNLSNLKELGKSFAKDLGEDVKKAFNSVGFGSLNAQTTKPNTPNSNRESEIGLGTGSKTPGKEDKNAKKLLQQQLKAELKAQQEAQKALDDAKKLEEKYLEDLAKLAYDYAQDELANQIKNNGEKIKNAKILTDELVNIERDRLQQIAKLEQDKINQERAEADRKAQDANEQASNDIIKLEVDEARKNQLRINADNVLKAQLDLNELKFNQKTLENQNELDLSTATLEQTAYDNKKAVEDQRREFEFQQNILSLENQGNQTIAIKKAQIDEDARQEIARLKQLNTDKIITDEEYNNAVLAVEQQSADAKKEIDKIVNKERLSEIGNTLGQVSKLLGENTKAGKIAGSAQALINTYQGVTEVWASESSLPEPFATIAKVASTATVLASGLNAVKQINKVSTESLNSANGSAGGATTNTYKSTYAGGANGLEGLSVSGYNQSQTFGGSDSTNLIADAVREGARAGASEGSSEGLIGLSTNREILNNAKY